MSEATPETPAAAASPAPAATAAPAGAQTPAPAAQPAQEAAPQPEGQDVESLPSWAREAISKANREAADFRTKLREAEPIVARAREAEEAQKSAQERAEDAARRAQEDAQEARSEALRYKAAATHRVDADYFDLLGSGDEEAITGRAQRVGQLLAAQAENAQLKAELEALRTGKPAPPTARPVESLRPGATPQTVEPLADDSYPADFLPRRMRDRIAGANPT